MNLRNIVVGAALALLVPTAPASAQFLTFVSAAGNDANTCFVQAAPCKTLQRAINQTSAGGEVRLLTSLAGSGFINKSITIEGGYNTVIGIIVVNNASAIVRFRRLNLNGRHALATGFNLINAAAVHIEECSVERYSGDGIHLAAGVSSELVVSDSVVRDNGEDGLESEASSGKVTIGNTRFEHNANTGTALVGQASVFRSISFGAFQGFLQLAGAINMVDTAVVASPDVGYGLGIAGPGGEMTLDSCLAIGNGNGLFVAEDSSARVSECVFVDNVDDGIDTDQGATATTLTLGNNLAAGNAGSDVEGTLTPLAGE